VPGDEILVLTWLHLAQRDVLAVHPRGDQDEPEQGVFSARSPHRPNPIGLHRAVIIAVEPARLRVGPLEAVDGTPVLDVNPV
jgi:tRNA-Thr(GGU) m(6)t(6)A37 methyltransferase TsaA